MKTIIAEKVGITTRHLQYLLRAERNASPKLARKLSRVTGVPKEMWCFGTRKQREAAWKKRAKNIHRENQ